MSVGNPLENSSSNFSLHEEPSRSNLSGSTTLAREFYDDGRPSPDEQDPSEVGPYRVIAPLGRGSYGCVYEAIDPGDPTLRVAIKIPRPDRLSDGLIATLLEEAERARQLDHDRIVRVIDVQRDAQLGCYIVMDYVDGKTLDKTIRLRDGINPEQKVHFMAELAEIIHYLHQKGFVYRDLSPTNIMVDTLGRPIIIDLGMIVPDGERQPETLTGTPAYMAPEQTEMEAYFNTKIDIWCLGVILYEWLTGQRPFQGDARDELFHQIQHKTPRSIGLLNPDVREEIQAVCMRCLEKKPNARFSTADALAKALRRALVEGVGTAVSVRDGLDNRWDDNDAEYKAIKEFEARITQWAGDPRDCAIVGILHSLTGSLAVSERPLVKATLLAVNEINANGGLLGKKLYPIVVDGKSNSKDFRAGALELLQKQWADVIFGCWTSAARMLVSDVVEREDSLLFYPVAYEGLQDADHMVCTGALPNQDIYPGLEWCLEQFADSENLCRFGFVGSDYFFPRVAHVLVEKWIAAKGQILLDAHYLPFYSAPTDGTCWEKIESAVEQFKKPRPNVILNFINGVLNRAFFQSLYENGVTPETPTLSFSIGEPELQLMPPQHINGLYLVGSYFEQEPAEGDGSFAAEYKSTWGEDEITSEETRDAYANIYVWAEAVRAAESTRAKDVRSAIARLSPEQATICQRDVTLEVDPKTRHAHKSPMIGKIRAGMGGMLIEPVCESGQESVSPHRFPDDGVAPAVWKEFARRYWLACDVVPTLEQYSCHIDEIRESFLDNTTAPTARSVAFIDSARSGEDGFHEKLGHYRSLGIFSFAHNLQDIRNVAAQEPARFVRLANEGLQYLRQEIGCTDDDVTDLFRPTGDIARLVPAVTKAKAFAYRTRRAYLFDVLHFALKMLRQDVYVNGEPAREIEDFECLFHENLHFPLSSDWHFHLFESLQWYDRDQGARRQHSLKHYVDIEGADIEGRGATPTSVAYSLVAQGEKRQHGNSIDKLAGRSSGDAARLYRTMCAMFDASEAGETLVVKRRQFDVDQWLETKDTGNFVFDWQEKGQQTLFGLALAGRCIWTDLQWPPRDSARGSQ